MHVLKDKFKSILQKHSDLESLMSAENLDPTELATLSKQYADLSPVCACIHDLFRFEKQYEALKQTLEDEELDAAFKDLAYEEMGELSRQKVHLEKEIQRMLLPKDEDDARNAIVEIRAGTGGDEAALFAADLWRMYQRYADLKGWKTEVLHLHESDLGGIKDLSMMVKGAGVFAYLKYESGVHRVQRIPATETGGRIHTSASTVAVLPEVEEVDIHIQESDLRYDTFRSSGAGGQHVNTTDSAVRITHIPTGLMVSQQDEKSQHKNKAKALKILRARLYDLERQKREAERAETRKSQVGSGDRSERIRTYNFPQGRLTDHRINLTLYKLEQILQGEGLGDVISALISADQAEKLSQMDQHEAS